MVRLELKVYKQGREPTLSSFPRRSCSCTMSMSKITWRMVIFNASGELDICVKKRLMELSARRYTVHRAISIHVDRETTREPSQ